MSRRLLTSCLALLLLATGAALSGRAMTVSTGGQTFAIPAGSAPTLDGRMMPDEWGAGLRLPFSDGGELRLLESDGALCLGIGENFEGLTTTSVFLERDGVVSILHVSGSLGTARYAQAGDRWALVQPFVWGLYGVTTQSATAQNVRQAHFTRNGWLANLGSMTTTQEIEVKVVLAAGTYRLAIAYLCPADWSRAALCPMEVSDDTGNGLLLRANAPDSMTLHFEPQTWMTLEVPGA